MTFQEWRKYTTPWQGILAWKTVGLILNMINMFSDSTNSQVKARQQMGTRNMFKIDHKWCYRYPVTIRITHGM